MEQPPNLQEMDDAAILKKMGYEQELHRHMSAFSNFAISFSIICILAGGITAFPQALGAGGGTRRAIPPAYRDPVRQRRHGRCAQDARGDIGQAQTRRALGGRDGRRLAWRDEFGWRASAGGAAGGGDAPKQLERGQRQRRKKEGQEGQAVKAPASSHRVEERGERTHTHLCPGQ